MSFAPGLAGAESADEKASPAAVASGLRKISDIASDSAKAIAEDGAKAEELQAGIEPVWETIEATVKANDTGTYVALEDNFTLLKIAAKGADAAKASAASEKLSAAVEDYLAKNPGGPDNLPRTGSGDLSVAAGAALALGGLGLLGGARKHIRR